MIQPKNHYRYIDAAKGIGILLIVLGHVVPNRAIHQFVYSFHVPLFFLLSGFTYRVKSDKKQFYLTKFKRLLVPYYIFAVVSIVIYFVMSHMIPLSGDSRIGPNLLGMLYANSNTGYMMWNRPLWFLPCLFASFLILDTFETILQKKNFRNQNGLRIAFVLLLWAAGIFLNDTVQGVFLPFHLESAVFLTGFSEVGLLAANYIKEHDILPRLKERKLRSAAVLLALILAGFVLSRINGGTDVHAHMFGKYPILLVMTSLLCSCAAVLVSLFCEDNKFLLCCGSSSLAILLMHKFPILFFQEIVPYVRDALAANDTLLGTCCGIAISLVTVILCLAVEKVIQMICPALVGRSK